MTGSLIVLAGMGIMLVLAIGGVFHSFVQQRSKMAYSHKQAQEFIKRQDNP
jgi:uncharacterized protein HemX